MAFTSAVKELVVVSNLPVSNGLTPSIVGTN